MREPEEHYPPEAGGYQIANQQSVQGQVIGDQNTITQHFYPPGPSAAAVSPPASLHTTRFGKPFPAVWNVSRRHHAFFTGREQVLQRLWAGFRPEPSVGIVPAQALTGMGGIGKTQTAAEYAYRFREHYQVVLWVRADTREKLLTDLQTSASFLHLPQERLREQEHLLHTIQEWFRMQTHWLLIVDNADNLELLEPFVPRGARGHLLFTTRVRATVAQAHPLVLKALDPDQGALCILRRAGLLAWNEPLKTASPLQTQAAQQLSTLMDGLPLALEQAGAYIEETGCGVSGYLQRYQQYRQEIQRLHPGVVPEYPASVASAWRLSQQMVEQANPAAADLFRVCAYLAPEAIPDELLTAGAAALGPVLGPVAADPLALDQAISLLRTYSLLSREVDRDTDVSQLSIHRVIQEILLDEMDESTRLLWAERVVRALEHASSTVHWSQLQVHVHACLRHLHSRRLRVPDAERLRQRLAETVPSSIRGKDPQ